MLCAPTDDSSLAPDTAPAAAAAPAAMHAPVRKHRKHGAPGPTRAELTQENTDVSLHINTNAQVQGLGIAHKSLAPRAGPMIKNVDISQLLDIGLGVSELVDETDK